MFYIIAKRNAKESKEKCLELLKNACLHKYEFEIIYSESFNFDTFKVQEKSIFYRIDTSRRAKLVEKFLISKGALTIKKINKVRTINHNFFRIQKIYKKNQIPVIPTSVNPPLNSKSLEKVVKKLDGFPLVIKEAGSSEGKNVLKVDSMDSLISTLSYVKEKSENTVFVKKYIPHQENARLFVLGDKVIASKGNLKVSKDFRLNNDFSFNQEKRDYDSHIEDIAVKASELIGVEFSGVDILLADDGKIYLAEVNSPANFSYTQKVTEVNIAQKLVDYLHNKVSET